MKIKDFGFNLPDNLIAQEPVSPRDHSKLMVLSKMSGKIKHYHFYDLPKLLNYGDVLVFNQTKVFPARLYGNKSTGGKVQVLLQKSLSEDLWEAISHPGLKNNQIIIFSPNLSAKVIDISDIGITKLEFYSNSKKSVMDYIIKIGKTPLPPYIQNQSPENILRQEYQTIYAKNLGSAAAPTAGFHFTKKLLLKLKKKRVQLEFVTLHVGLGTFKPVTEKNIQDKRLHAEEFFIDSETSDRLNQAKREGRRIISVGTTSTRVLETCAKYNSETDSYEIKDCSGKTEIFIYPPYKFKFVDGLITNFHIPKSSLLMLVSSLVTTPNTTYKFVNFKSTIIHKAYQEAIDQNYRFYSFGDAMFIS